MAADSEASADLQNPEKHSIFANDQVVDRADPLILFVQNRLALEISGPQPLCDCHDIHDDHVRFHDLRNKSDRAARREGDRQHADATALASTRLERETVWIHDRALWFLNLVCVATHDTTSVVT